MGREGNWHQKVLKPMVSLGLCRPVESIGNDEVGSSILPSSTRMSSLIWLLSDNFSLAIIIRHLRSLVVAGSRDLIPETFFGYQIWQECTDISAALFRGTTIVLAGAR